MTTDPAHIQISCGRRPTKSPNQTTDGK